MRRLAPLTDEEGEVRELTTADFKNFRPAEEILSPLLMAKLAARKRDSQKPPNEESVTIRLSHDVLEKFRATGKGWQTRLDAALRDWLDTHTPA